jgi:methionyl-tRNA formyltransferase
LKNVIIFSPSRFSLYTICVTELLIRKKVNIKAIVVRKLLNPSRFFDEFGRDKSRLIKKIWKKLILRSKSYKNTNYETLDSFMKKEKIFVNKVEFFNKKYEVPIVYCKDLNDRPVEVLLENICPDLVIFTGGGLIRKQVLEKTEAGILNCHMGILPQYRGMDVVEWPILEGNLDQLGMTVYFMDNGVDTGDILRKKRVQIQPGESIKQLRDRFEPIMCRHLVETCCEYLNGKIQRIPQKPEEGKQYFIMHRHLVKLAESKINPKSIEEKTNP